MKKLQPKFPKLTTESLEASFQKFTEPKKAEETAQKVVEKPVVEAPKKAVTPKKATIKKPATALKKSEIRLARRSFREGGNRQSDLPPTKREGRTRITVDVPDEIYALMDDNKVENGQSITHLVVSLLKKHFAKR